jgi:hypothetical protein
VSFSRRQDGILNFGWPGSAKSGQSPLRIDVKKSDLLKALAQYGDDQVILVEASDGGFDEPVIYVSAVRGRKGQEFVNGKSSEYLSDLNEVSFGAVVLGTAIGLVKLS